MSSWLFLRGSGNRSKKGVGGEDEMKASATDEVPGAAKGGSPDITSPDSPPGTGKDEVTGAFPAPSSPTGNEPSPLSLGDAELPTPLKRSAKSIPGADSVPREKSLRSRIKSWFRRGKARGGGKEGGEKESAKTPTQSTPRQIPPPTTV